MCKPDNILVKISVGYMSDVSTTSVPFENCTDSLDHFVLGTSLPQQQGKSYMPLPVNCNKGCHITRQCEEYFIRCHALAT